MTPEVAIIETVFEVTDNIGPVDGKLFIEELKKRGYRLVAETDVQSLNRKVKAVREIAVPRDYPHRQNCAAIRNPHSACNCGVESVRRIDIFRAWENA